MTDADQLALGPGPEALRSSFGDRKLDISRKITACVACRKQKIKCHMPDPESPCVRCKKRGLSCSVNRSLQMLLEDNAAWKNQVTRKIQMLESMMDTVRDKLSLPPPPNAANGDDAMEYSQADDSILPARTTNPRTNQYTSPGTHRQGWEVRMDTDSGPAAVPASCVGEVDDGPVLNGRSPSRPGDLISDGVISADQAQALFDIYHDRLDHYLYRILGDQTNLRQVRTQSPLLLAATCTVAALHSSTHGHTYESCYEHLAILASRASIARTISVDDIRGLLIGAFWLHDLSWSFVSIAARAATQNHYHKAFPRAMDGDKAAYLQTRLWYHVYVCDHHFSIAYGRPPLTHQSDATDNAKTFLQSRHANESDARLVSQVEIWSLASRTLDDFGFDVDVTVRLEATPRMRRYMIALDTWRADWNERFAPNAFVGEYPRKGVGLHFHFAKLYLCAHAFRGLATTAPFDQPTRPSAQTHGHGSSSSTTASSPLLNAELEEIASVAVHSAKSILRIIINDTEIQAHLHGLSLYFDTMIVFAIVFLLKVATQYGQTVPIDASDTLSLVAEMSAVLNSITSSMQPQHLLVTIARGVETIVERCRAGIGAQVVDPPRSVGSTGGIIQHEQQPQHIINTAQTMQVNDWNNMLGDQQDLGLDWINYDFLANQDAFTMDNSYIFGAGYTGN